MAIPFFEEDEPQNSLQVLCAELSVILARIETLRRTNGHNRTVSRLPRVCCDVDCTRRVRRVTRVLLSAEQVNAMNAQAPLLNADEIHALNTGNVENLNNGNMMRFRVLRPCCSNTGILPILAAVPDLQCGQWAKDCVKIRKGEACADMKPEKAFQPKDESNVRSTAGLFSKIFPYTLSSSLWTAVICVVGWHLLRAR